MTLSIRPVRSAVEVEAARDLFMAYAESLDFDLCFQGFDAEMARFPGEYVPPEGDLLLAMREDQPVGVVAVRRFADGVAEMKRLYLTDAARGLGAGRRLAEQVVERARALGYRSLRLDTASSMVAAIHLYQAMGFRRLPPPEPTGDGAGASPELIYFELGL